MNVIQAKAKNIGMRMMSLMALILIQSSLYMSTASAQYDLHINVMSKGSILPPQVGQYKSDPGKLFMVTITNTGNEEAYVYFGLQLEYYQDVQGMPVNDLQVSTPVDRPTAIPYTIAPGTTTLSDIDLRRMFNHIPTSQMKYNKGIFGNIGSSDYGLLPEGSYRAILTAYKWDKNLIGIDNRIADPVPMSDPTLDGICEFKVCYRAQAPQLQVPNAEATGTTEAMGATVLKLPSGNPEFAWTEPVINCTSQQWRYELIIKEVLDNGTNLVMSPQEVIDAPGHPFAVRAPALTQSQCVLNYNALKRLKEGKVYVAQVTATPYGGVLKATDFNYTMVENKGKSNFLVFTVDNSNGLPAPEADEEPDDGGGTIIDNGGDEGDDNGDGDEDEDDEEDDLNLTLLGVEYEIGEDDAKYVFRNPNVVKPDAGKVVLAGNNLESKWEAPAFVGGEGQRPDTLQFRYRAQIFGLDGYAEIADALQQEPIYDGYVKGSMPEKDEDIKTLPKVGLLSPDDNQTAVGVMEDYILWTALAGHVSVGDALLLRILPECINEESVRFFDDKANTVAFTYSDKLSEAFGNTCAEGSIQENRQPISISAGDMKGKTVKVGEYNMEMGNDVKQEGNHSWSGSGWIIWTPFGQKVKVGVKFESIFINSDYIMYDGVVKTESKSNWQHLKDRANKLTNELTDTKNLEEWIPDDIFTDWGLDNLVSASTPESLSAYMDGYKEGLAEDVNNLAKKVKASKYYDYVRKGYAVYENFMNGDYGSMPDVEVFLPLQLPKKVNPSPVDIQVISMEWEPTRAWMNLIGMTTLPDNDITEENILMFGAPRTCMDPDRILPGTGNIILLEDLKLNDPKSDFSIKFFAPQNKERPEDGCMIHWENDALQMLSVKAEIEIPDLVKCDEHGKRIEGEKPKMLIEGKVEDWENWYAAVTIDPFEHEDLPGWTFKATDVTLDLSVKQNNPSMVLPAGYDKSHFPKTKSNSDDAWTGLFIKEVTVMMPDGFLKNGDERFSITGTDMLFDKSGVTASIGLKDPVNASIDDWALRIKNVTIDILQNNFDGCGMNGDIHVPLTHKEDYIAFRCDMFPVHHNHKKYTADNPNPDAEKYTTFDYLLKIQPTEDGENELDGKLNFDFFLAQLKLANKQTYFLLEAIDQGPDKGYDTKVELCMAGEISIGSENMSKVADEYLESKKLPFDFSLPGIHFTQMRLSNRKRDVVWEHAQSVRQAAQDDYEAHKGDKKFSIPLASENKTFEFGTADSPCYFDCGNWSVASFDKKIGPFAFGIDNYDFNRVPDSDTVYIDVKGRIGLVMDGEDALISATTTLRFNAQVNVKEKSFSYAGTDFRGCSLDIKTMGMEIYGELNVNDGTSDGKNGVTDAGYDGKLKFTMPGDFFSIEAEGGYYEHKADSKDANDENFAWGYFKAAVASKAGIHIDPVVINRIMGGFYFNCQPTKGGDSKYDPYGGKPQGKQGPIGIAFGLGLSTSAGEDALKADVNLLVVYDRNSKRLSTFMMNGDLEAVGGIVKANVSIIYEHTTLNPEATENQTGAVDRKSAPKEVTKDKYLALNITVDAGVDSKSLMEKVTGANSKLEDIKKSMDAFQSELDDLAKVDISSLTTDQTTSLSNISGDPNKTEGEDDTVKEKKNDDKDFSAGKTHVALEFKITWYKDGEKLNKWHLYVGEPAKDKRCYFTLLKYKSKICSVDIGADAYLCLGNELPDGGALPPIPDKITKFLAGEKKEGVDMGADLEKVEKSRAQATKALLNPNNLKGGVMVGASAWGEINVDLGLIFGGIDALAGFDLSLANYGHGAVCINSGSRMGYEGWYAMGQLYAYLYAKLGLQVKIGKLINKQLTLIESGIGGVLEMGLPNPTWVEGQLRVKLVLLDGLFKLDKKFSFSAGDHCVPFAGNALAGFEMFQDVSLGSDSLYEALCNPETAIRRSDANRMVFTTNTSLGSHYRLVDPSYQAYTGNDSLLSIHNSRTYVFDVEKNSEWGLPYGVEVYDLGTLPTELAAREHRPSEAEFLKALRNAVDEKYDNGKSQESLLRTLGKSYYQRAWTVGEDSKVMKNENLDSGEKRVLDGDNKIGNTFSFYDGRLKGVSFREDKGTTFHLTNMNLQPGHSYMLLLRGTAYEIKNGRRKWVEYYDEKNNNEPVNIKWEQTKLWFFRVKSEAEDVVVGDSLRDLTPYVALAYPSVDGTNVQSKGVTTTAYMGDILHPTIALNRNLSNELPKNSLKWVLDYYKSDNLEKPLKTSTVDADYKISGNCYNIEPKEAFSYYNQFVNAHSAAGAGYNFNSETYRLRLTHTYKYEDKDSTVALVDLWLNPAPYGVTINGKKYSDNWMQTTAGGVTGKLLPYTEPFVGARPWEEPTIDYETRYKALNIGGKLNDDKTFIYNKEKYNDKPYRLIDPYLYLAYLSKWTFIGDRAISAYAFDDVATPLGSETLIFQKANSVMNAEFLKNDKNVKSLYDVRNNFYSTWNDWSYNNAALPQYPLPITLGSVGGPTLNNQDDRVSTITPINLNFGESQTYNLTSLVKDFSAPYVVASQMSQKLYREARNLFGGFTSFLKKDDNGKITGLNGSGFHRYMKMLSDLHRGQYIEATSGDVTAKVPYYQMPLIFGGCFGNYNPDDIGGVNTRRNVSYKGVSLDESNRAFNSSIGASDMTSDLRRVSQMANLFFFRLSGSDIVDNSEPEVFCRYNTDMYNSDWHDCYLEGNKVAWDYYDANEGLKAVSNFKARIYRVDAFDTSTGLYILSSPDDDGSGMGAGPWYKDISINATNIDVKNLGEMSEGIAANEQFAATHYEHAIPQALYTAGNQTLTLVYSDSVYVTGNKIGGYEIAEVWANEFDSKMQWNTSVKKQLKKVVFDPSFAKASIQSTAHWFQQCENLEQISDMKYLNTSKVTDMSSMFWYCSKLKSIDISMFDMSNVESLHSIFSDCAALTSVKMNLDMPKVETMPNMFNGCSALQTIDIKSFEGTQVKDVDYLFSGCPALKTLRIDKFEPANVESCSNVFKGTGSINKGLTVYYSYYLDERIKEQIPSWATLVEGESPVKALHVKNSKGEQMLLFLNSKTDYAKNYSGSIQGKSKTYSNMTVLNVWKADQVLNTGDTPGWNSVKSNLVKVIIDPSFTDAPKSTKNWFSNCTSLTKIEGLDKLRLPSDISGMFKNCQKLQLDVNSLDLSNVEIINEAFYGCEKLTSVNLNLALAKIKNISGLFRGCSNLEEVMLTLPNGLTDLSQLFMGCSKLKEIDFSRLHTEDVKSMRSMFNGCSSLQKLKLNLLTTEKCADQCTYMFRNVPTDCHVYLLKSTYDGNQTIKGQLPRTSYVNLHLIGDDAVALKVKKAGGDYKLVFLKKQPNVSYDRDGAKYQGMEIASVTPAADFMVSEKDGSPWGEDFSITEVEFTSSFAEVQPASTMNWFRNFQNLSKVSGLQYLNTSETTTMKGMFCVCSSLTSVSDLSISESVTDLSELFWGCKKLKTVSFGTVNTSKVTDMSSMFSNCAALEELSLEKFNSASVRNMEHTFNGCSNLRTLKLSNDFTAAQVEAPDTKYTFYGVHDMLVDLPAANVAAVRNNFIDKLGFVDGKTGWIGRESMAEALKKPQVIWTADNATLTFYYGTLREPGDEYGRKKITKVWSGNDVENTPVNNAAPWTSPLLMAGKDVKVVIDESFSKVKPLSTNYWFALYRISSIEGLQYLNTSKLLNVNGMFKGSNLTSLDLSTFNFSNVTSANELFADCTSLKSLKMSNQRVAALGSGNANPFVFSNVAGRATDAFKNVKDLDITVEPTSSVSTVKSSWVSKLGFIDGTHGRFVTGDKVMQAIWTSANKTLTFVYRPAYSSGQQFNGQTITSVWLDGTEKNFSSVVKETSLTNLLNGKSFGYNTKYKKWTQTVKNSMTKVVFDASFADAKPKTMCGWFAQCGKLTAIEGMEYLNTSEVTDMSYLFDACSSLQSIDLSHFNTTKVTTMAEMFRHTTCATIDLSSFDTNNVTDMYGMFWSCSKLTTIKGGDNVKFNNVTDMSFMFYNCPNLDLSFAAVMLNGFLLTATGKVKNMRWMFAGNNGSAIYIYTLGTGSVTTMENMFYGCKNLTTLNLTNLRTQNVKNMSYMFAECPKLNINGSNDWAKFSTQSVTTMEGMFKGCAAMSYLNLSKWNTSKVTSMKEMFSGCKALKTLIVGSDFSVAGMTSQTNVFTGVTGLTIKMPTAVFDNRSTIFTSKLGFTTSNGYMINGDY